MKIVRFKWDNKILWGAVDEDRNVILSNVELTKDIQSFDEVIKIFNNAKEDEAILKDEFAFSDVALLAPVLPTKNILCIGKNYHDHILEFDGNADDVERVREVPIFFSKALSSVTGHNAFVYLHENICTDIDYEAELAVIMGKSRMNITEEEALDNVFGYTILNDVTSRDLQANHQQWFKGKSLDTHCPIGPWIVTKDEIADPNNLDIRSEINGEIRQNANTKLMMHDVKALIVQLSKGMTLNAGDVIATGTPKGVGKGFKPPKYLKDGDKVEVIIQDIGRLTNTMKTSK